MIYFNYYYSYLIILYVKIINKPAGLAQSVERGTFNPEVKGSSPLFGDNPAFLESNTFGQRPEIKCKRTQWMPGQSRLTHITTHIWYKCTSFGNCERVSNENYF